MASGSEKSSLEKVTEAFEACWEELVKEYLEKRWIVPIWCSEADVQLHLAHKLLGIFPEGCVHVELPIPFEVEDFLSDLYFKGRVLMRKGKGKSIIPDVVVLNPEDMETPRLVAEIKFNPLYWNIGSLIDLLAVVSFGQHDAEMKLDELVSELGKAVRSVRAYQKKGPSKQWLESILKNIDKLIQLVKDFKNKMGEAVAGYLCIIDEVYPDIEDRIKKEIVKYDPPEHFKVLAMYYPAADTLEEIREKFVERLKDVQ